MPWFWGMRNPGTSRPQVRVHIRRHAGDVPAQLLLALDEDVALALR